MSKSHGLKTRAIVNRIFRRSNFKCSVCGLQLTKNTAKEHEGQIFCEKCCSPEYLEIEDQPEAISDLWYHGSMSREEANQLLNRDGDFLVRWSDTQSAFVVSMAWRNEKIHTVIPKDKSGTGYAFDGETIPTVSQWIRCHLTTGRPIAVGFDAVLKTPINLSDEYEDMDSFHLEVSEPESHTSSVPPPVKPKPVRQTSSVPPAVKPETVTQTSSVPPAISPKGQSSKLQNKPPAPMPLPALPSRAPVLRVIQDSVLSVKVDVIVNSLGMSLDLSASQVTKAIAQKAGPGMALELDQYRHHVSCGNILKTKGYGLPCSSVLHIVLQSQNDENTFIQLIRKALRDLFTTADRIEAKSIAIPAIGTGILKYSKRMVAELLFSEASEYLASKLRINLQEVLLVVHPGDNVLFDIYNKLQDEFNKKPDASTHHCVSVSFNCPNPQYWLSSASSEVPYERCEISPTETEYDLVVDEVRCRGGDAFVKVIKKIERIENWRQWQMYNSSKKTMIEANGRDVENERFLWHGTSHDALGNIMSSGFNRNYGGKNAMLYGTGVYYAVAFSYSAQDIYAVPHNGRKHIFLARVLTGFYGRGIQGLLEPPFKDVAKQKKYDSTVDSVECPTIFVIFRDYLAYPEYLITI